MIYSALLLVPALATAWPGMKAKSKVGDEDYIGPSCTVGAHNWHPESGPCPNMEQPAPPAPSSNNSHVWPSQYVVDWEFYFVPNDSDEPPYNPLPSTPYNVTHGKTFYFNDEVTGLRNMREDYDEYCIPVFGTLLPMGTGNKYSCSFLNVGVTNISYVLTYEDRPPLTPECCIIGQPFHAPPPDFSTLMPVHWTDAVGDTMVDWNAVYDKDAGIFSYGFETESSHTPYAFYMKGMPWVANWMWQKFRDFKEETPPAEVWNIPEACISAKACPGW